MRAEPSLTVISLGGGVQSSVMALMASQSLPPTGSGGAFDRVPDCAIFADTRWEPPSVYEHIQWLEGQLSFPLYVVDSGRSLPRTVRRNYGHTRLPEGKERRGRRHRPPPVHRQLQDQAHQTQDTRPARTETPAASLCWNDRRAVAGNLHRRGHPHEGLPRQVDGEPLSPHRGGHVPKRLLGLVGSPLRQAPGTLGLRRLPVPVPSQMGGDQAQMAGAVRRGGGDRRQVAGRAGIHQGAVLAYAADAPLAEAVALDEAELGTDGQRDGFGNECEGHCGV